MQTQSHEQDPQLCKGYGNFKTVGQTSEKITVVSQLIKKTEECMPFTAHTPPSLEPSQTDDDVSSSSILISHENEHGHFPDMVVESDEKVSKLTSIRPVVTKYSSSRYSLNEWRKRNEVILSAEVINKSNLVDLYAQSAIAAAFGTVDKHEIQNNNRLKHKARELHRWKEEVLRSCEAITKEVLLLETERQRLKGASRVILLPESISEECLQLRCQRSEPDLVSDLVEIELKKELELVAEVRSTLTKTLKKVDEQLVVNNQAKHKVEFDYCEKKTAYDLETINLGLHSRSKTLQFKPGSTRFNDFSGSLEFWEHFCRENIAEVEAVRQRSMDLRGTLNFILINGGRKLRIQADKTDKALAQNVAMTQELCGKMELTLQNTLQKIADIEKLIDKLNDSIINMDSAMKLAQTRLDNRNSFRARNECVRDQPHIGLMHEIKTIHELVTSLLNQLNNAKKVRGELMVKRKELENEIAAKRMTLCIDRDRCGIVRSHYPSESELSGF